MIITFVKTILGKSLIIKEICPPIKCLPNNYAKIKKDVKDIGNNVTPFNSIVWT